MKIGGGVRLMGWTSLIAAALMIATGSFAMAHLSRVGGILAVLFGAWYAARGVIVLGVVRGGAERACRLNA